MNQLNHKVIDKIENLKLNTIDDLLLLINHLQEGCWEGMEISPKNRIKKETLVFYGMHYMLPKHKYKEFVIQKKSGGLRVISSPTRKLKIIQLCLKVFFQRHYDLLDPHHSVCGFILGRSIVDGAKWHVGKKYVLNIDLKDFFDTIDFYRIKKMLTHPPFNLIEDKNMPEKNLPCIIANLCCQHRIFIRQDKLGNKKEIHRSVLPQGAPTSPVLSNLVCKYLDKHLYSLAKEYNAVYTRYADDITFSCNKNIFKENSNFRKKLRYIIESKEHFKINTEKTRVQSWEYKQEVTGLTVNKKLNVPKRYIKQLRMWLYYWERYGYERTQSFFINKYLSEKKNVRHQNVQIKNVICGKLDYLKMVVGENNLMYTKLLNRYKECLNKDEVNEVKSSRVSYNAPIQGDNWKYPVVKFPRKGRFIFPYRRQSIHRNGHMDKPFMEYLNSVFGNHLLVIGDCGILPQNNTLPFEPDVAIIDENNPNIRIDIEIDEPYSAIERKPIHYIGCGDEFRDLYMNNLGWIVIRFTEKQVFCDKEGCVAFIARVMFSINPKMDFLKKFISHPNPSPINRWTEFEAKIMESENFRESYLGIESFGEKSDNVQQQPQTQTKEEQEAARHITLISLDNSQKQSFSSVSENKLVNRDQYIQFFPIEHIYWYKEIEEFVSVSKLISYFFRPFDSAPWSQYKATERGISQGEILEEWDEKGTRSKEVGTFMHQQIENYFQGKGFNKEYSYLYKGRYINVEENISLEKECKQFISFLNTHNCITPHKTEWTIYDEDLKIAGTIDMLHKHDDVYDIYDWKRSHRIITHHGKPIIDNDYFTKGINGLDSVSDTVYWHYCIQQNLYRYILEKNYDIKIGKMYLIVLHADYDNYCKLEVPEMNDVINIIVQTCKNKSLSTILCSHKN